MAYQDSTEFQRILRNARIMGNNNRNRNRRPPGQGQGPKHYRQGDNGMQPNGGDFYRPNGPQVQAPYDRPHHGQRRPRPHAAAQGPYHQRQQYPAQQPLPQFQPPFQQRRPQQFVTPPQQNHFVPSQVRQNKPAAASIAPTRFQPPPPHNIFLDTSYLDDINPAFCDDTWLGQAMQFIDNGDKYQRPETSVEEGTGWLGDIEAPALYTEEDRLQDVLEEYQAGLEIAKHLEETENLLEQMDREYQEETSKASRQVDGEDSEVDGDGEDEPEQYNGTGYDARDITDEHWWQ